MKLPVDVILKFIKNNLDYKNEDYFEVYDSFEKEIRINSIYTKDKKYHCYISPSKNVFIDFKSGEQGSFIKLVKDFLDIDSNSKALDFLYKEYFTIDDSYAYLNDNFVYKENEYIKKQENEDVSKIQLPKINFFTDDISFIGKKALKYLLDRNINREIIKEYKIGYCYDGEYKDRIIIPFFENGIIKYFVSRTFDENNYLRYKNPKGINSKKFVFNYDRLQSTVGIVEGVFDAITLKYPVTTALLSADISVTQIKKILSKKPKKIIWIPDNDTTGKKTLEKNWKLFKNYEDVNSNIKHYVYFIKNGKDINENNITYININDCKPIDKLMFLNIYLKSYY